jgi:hypothetical protein
MLGGSGASGGSNECNRVAHSRTKKYPALWRPYFWNQPRNIKVALYKKIGLKIYAHTQKGKIHVSLFYFAGQNHDIGTV